MPKKTSYIILIIIAVLVLVGGLIWYLIFYPKETTTSPGAGFTVNGGALQKKGNLKLVSSSVVSASLNHSENSILFYNFSGELWQLKSGETTPSLISQKAIENPAEIIWSKNLKNVVKNGLSQSDATYISSDFTKNLLTNLKSGIKSVAFSPDASKIVFYISDLKTNALFTSDPDGRNQRTLANPLKIRDIVLSWPKTNQIGLSSKPSGLITGSLWVLDTRTSSYSKPLDGFFGLETLWSPDGATLIYSFTDSIGRNPKLSFFNKKGNSNIISGISTIVPKCVWAKNSTEIYCAVPKSWPESIVLPDDFYKKTFMTNDEIWKINVETGEKNLIASDLGDLANLLIGENAIYFIQRNSQFLYQLNLE